MSEGEGNMPSDDETQGLYVKPDFVKHEELSQVTFSAHEAPKKKNKKTDLEKRLERATAKPSVGRYDTEQKLANAGIASPVQKVHARRGMREFRDLMKKKKK